MSQRDPAAEKEFAAALEQDPNDSEALYFLGGFLMQADRLEEAVPATANALANSIRASGARTSTWAK